MTNLLDTDAQLDMSLDALIATKGRASKNRAQVFSGSGKVRSSSRADRRQETAPYARDHLLKTTGSLPNRLYVGNLAWGVTWKELKDHMKQAGRVVKADVATDPAGRSKGYGLVEFQTPSDARAAIDNLQNTDLMGRLVFLREDREPRSTIAGYGNGMNGVGGNTSGFGGTRNVNCKVFVSNLAFGVGWQNLKDHMRQAGNVLRADVFVDYDGRSKGYGTVEFSKPFEARNAIAQLNDTNLLGRPIVVREDRGDAAASGFLGSGVGGSVGARVYVGNLSWNVTWQKLKDYMRQAGNVKFVDMFQAPGGRSKGCAVVEYETPQGAHAAIRNLNDTELMGRMMFVREDREEGSAASKSQGPMSMRFPGAEGRHVFVSNLSWETTWKEAKDHFRQVGHVEFVEIPEDSQGRSMGYATVRFSSVHEAEHAVTALNDTELDGRRIFVREDNR